MTEHRPKFWCYFQKTPSELCVLPEIMRCYSRRVLLLRHYERIPRSEPAEYHPRSACSNPAAREVSAIRNIAASACFSRQFYCCFFTSVRSVACVMIVQLFLWDEFSSSLAAICLRVTMQSEQLYHASNKERIGPLNIADAMLSQMALRLL